MIVSGLLSVVLRIMINRLSINRIENQIIPPSIKESHASVGALYEHKDESVILDLVHCDKELGFACIVDGTGHNNSNGREPLKQHFDPFMKKYAEGMRAGKFESLEQITCYFEGMIRKWEEEFNNPERSQNNVKICTPEKLKKFEESEKTAKEKAPSTTHTFLVSTYKPAMSFVQVVRLKNNQVYLLTARADDTSVIIQDKDNNLSREIKPTLKGLGDPSHKTTVTIRNITGAKRAIMFSDGIGDFLTPNDLERIIPKTKSEDLFTALIDGFVDSPPSQNFNRKTRSATGGYLKEIGEKGAMDDKRDDVSLVVLDL